MYVWLLLNRVCFGFSLLTKRFTSEIQGISLVFLSAVQHMVQIFVCTITRVVHLENNKQPLYSEMLHSEIVRVGLDDI